jgi:hypothetical protein
MAALVAANDEDTRNMLVWRGYDTDQIDVNKADKTIGKAVDSLVRRFVKETRENG